MSSADVQDSLGLRKLLDLTRDESVVHSDELPWINYPSAEGVLIKPLKLDRRTGTWIELTRVPPGEGGRVNRHYHVGPTIGFVLEGSWYYEGRDWVARQGTFVYEPAGDIHTLIANDEGMTTLFVVNGGLLYMDDNDNVIGQEDVLSFTKIYHDYCREQGIEPVDLDP